MIYNGYKEIEDFYDRVRSLTGFQTDKLPNSTIDHYENAPRAEKQILSLIKDIESFDQEKLPVLETSIIYKTAISLVRTYSTTVGEGNIKIAQTINLKVEYFENAGNNISSDLEAILNDLLAELLGEDFSPNIVRFEITQ